MHCGAGDVAAKSPPETKEAEPEAKRGEYLDDDARIETLCLHAGYVPDATNSCGVPIYRTSSYVFESCEHAANLFALKELGNIYSRLQNPTTDVLEKRVATLEGANPMGGLAVSSGTSAAFYSIINLARAGDNIVSSNRLYGGTYTMFNNIFKDIGIHVKFVDINSQKEINDAIDSNTRAVYCETVSNPTLVVTDMKMVTDTAHKRGVPVIADSTFTTPYIQRPMDFGVDIVIHSLTKWMGGHGTGIGGVIVDSGKFNWGAGQHPMYDEKDMSYHGLRWGHDLPAPLLPLAYILRARTVPLRNLGACISPDNAWMFCQGIETLPLRMERHCSNALAVAKFLKAQPNVEWVRFPGLPGDEMNALNDKYCKGLGGSMVVFEVKGGRAAGQKFIENLKLFRHLANVGDAKSLAIHPASTTHSQLSEEDQRKGGMSPGLIRLAIGIEHIDDIVKDLNKGLSAARAVDGPKTKTGETDL